MRALFLSACLALTGCAAPLQTAVDVVNVVSAGSVPAISKVNADFAAAEHACLASAVDLPSQRSCLDRTEARFVPALQAGDDLAALLALAVAVIRTEEARERAGGAPALAQVTMLVPELLTLAQRFNDALVAMRATVTIAKGTP